MHPHYETRNIGQLYRDRAVCGNGFDEIKNQSDWGGYGTHDIERCALSARAVALVYNWWSGYLRLAHPKTRLEAITSRPKLLSAVRRMTSHGGQKKILLTITHEAATQIKALVANVRHGLQPIAANAPQLPKSQLDRDTDRSEMDSKLNSARNFRPSRDSGSRALLI